MRSGSGHRDVNGLACGLFVLFEALKARCAVALGVHGVGLRWQGVV